MISPETQQRAIDERVERVSCVSPSVDLAGGTVDGGKFDRLTGALSWYPTSSRRVEFNYGYGRLDRSGLVGHTNFYQLRLQFQL
jgi:hypothetical protein